MFAALILSAWGWLSKPPSAPRYPTKPQPRVSEPSSKSAQARALAPVGLPSGNWSPRHPLARALHELAKLETLTCQCHEVGGRKLTTVVGHVAGKATWTTTIYTDTDTPEGA